MGIIRFFFGSGLWILLYVGLYLWWLFSVVLWMAIFASEVRNEGTPANPASPGSILILMVACGLAGSTAVTVAIALSMRWSVPWGIGIGLLVGAVVAIVGGMVNIWLAQDQSRTAYRVNVALCVVVIFANLLILFIGLRRAEGAPPLPVAGNNAAISGA